MIGLLPPPITFESGGMAPVAPFLFCRAYTPVNENKISSVRLKAHRMYIYPLQNQYW